MTAFDIKVAFDRVWHQGALVKLSPMGIRGQTLRWLESHLLHRKMVVVVEGQSSQLQDISAGVPQGSVLGPTIFSCFINDLPSVIRSEVGMFANDCTMFSTIRDSSDTEAVHVQMQQDLDNIQAWADKWQVTFTPHKCQTMTITNKRHSNHHPLTFNSITITESPTVNILGVTIDQKLNWTHHINTVATRAGQRLRNTAASSSPPDSPKPIHHLHKSGV